MLLVAYDLLFILIFSVVENIQYQHGSRCTIKIFRGGEGVMDGEGGSSERCLKWGGGGGGSLRDLSRNISKQGVGKGKSCS